MIELDADRAIQIVIYRDRESDLARYRQSQMIELDGDRVNKIKIYRDRRREIELFIDRVRQITIDR